MSRPIGGLACKLRMSLRHYDALALVVRDNGHDVRLIHRDPALCVDLVEFAGFDEAEDYRDRLADFLKLPTLMLAGRAAAAHSASKGKGAKARRLGSARARRPRFLTRRETGGAVATGKVEGQELIARN